MMKCMRRPKALSGSQWKTSRCSQYSVRVQIPIPASVSSDQLQGAQAAVGAEPLHHAITTGTKMIAGIDGWTREKKFRKSLSKSCGEAAQPGCSLVSPSAAEW